MQSMILSKMHLKLLERLEAFINSGDIEIINMHTEGDGEQDIGTVYAPSGEGPAQAYGRHTLGWCQHLHFTSTRTTGSVAADFLRQGTPTDQYLSISQIQVGEGTVPVSIVLYINGTYLKNWS